MSVPEVRQYDLRPNILEAPSFLVAKVQYTNGSSGAVVSLGLRNERFAGEVVTIHLGGDKTCALKWVKELEEAAICLKKCYELDESLLDSVPSGDDDARQT